MLVFPEEAEVLERLVEWASAQSSVRALVLTSSRARGDGSADALSDYDVILAVPDAADFAASGAWAAGYGRPLVRWGDEDELLGLPTYFRGVVYEDGVRVDYTVWPTALLERVAEEPSLPDVLDVGYRVLVDKDGRTARWRLPTHRAHMLTAPTEAEYLALVDEFWWDAIHAARSLCRGEIVFAKFLLDFDAKLVALCRFLEWRIAIDRDWTLKPGKYGRGLERLLPADTWSELASTYVGTNVEENWEALFRTTALFHRVATEVAEALGYEYPEQVEGAVIAHLTALRAAAPAR